MNMEWQYAWSEPEMTADFKTTIQDFYVEEVLGFEPDGEGEHLYLYVEKQGINTDYLAKLLAQHVGIPKNKVTYSGVKDRHAVTRQWFCLHVLNAEPNFDHFMESINKDLHEHEAVRIIQQTRHRRKLKIGTHKANRFIIRLRRLNGPLEDLENRLALVALAGVPNYFGPQRFGIDGNNLTNGINWLNKKSGSKKRFTKTESFWVSAVRSWFFNEALSDQVAADIWNSVFIEDRVQAQYTSSQSKVDKVDATLLKQLHHLDVHPLMPLPNSTALQNTSPNRAKAMAASWQQHKSILESMLELDFSREERTTRLYPMDMKWEIADAQLILQFTLTKGSFATSVLRELVKFTNCSGVEPYENLNSQ